MSSIVVFDSSSDALVSTIDSAMASILSPADIKAMAVLDIQPPLGTREKQIINATPHKLLWTDIPADPTNFAKPMKLSHQLSHGLMGSTDFATNCLMCGANNALCPGHPSCSSLPWPIQHVSFAKRLVKVLNVVCMYCSRLLFQNLDNMEVLPDLYPGQHRQWNRFWKSVPKVHDAKKPKKVTCPHCCMPNPTWSFLRDIIYASWPDEIYFPSYTPPVGALLHMRRVVLDILQRDESLQSELTQVMAATECSLQDLPASTCLEFVLVSLMTRTPQQLKDDEYWLMHAISFLHPSHRQVHIRQAVTSARLQATLTRLRREDITKMGHHHLLNHPVSLVWTVMPVAPKSLRPDVSEISGGHVRSSDSMTKQYVFIFGASARLRYYKMVMCIDAKNRLRALCCGQDVYMPSAVYQVFDAVDPWHFTDFRSHWFDYNKMFLQLTTELQHNISWLIDQQASVAQRPSSGNSSSKVGAQNASKNAVFVEEVSAAGVGGDVNSEESSRGALASAEADGLVSAASVNPKSGGRGPASKRHHTAASHVPIKNRPVSAAVLINATEERASTRFVLLAELSESSTTCDDLTVEEMAQHEANIEKHVLEVAHALYSALAHSGTSSWCHPRLFSATSQESLTAASNLSLHFKPTGAHHYSTKLGLPTPLTSQYTARRPKKQSIADKQKGKEGSVKGNGRKKRSDNTARMVLTPDGGLAVYQVGISRRACQTQTVPVTVNAYTMNMLQRMVAVGAGHLDGAHSIVTSDKRVILLDNHELDKYTHEPVLHQDPKHIFLAHGWTVHIYIQEGTHVIVNRQPSLHRPSHDALRCTPTKGKVISMHENVMTGKGADCDGDAVCTAFLQSLESRVEACLLMSMPCNIVCPRTHRPISSLHQDSLLGAYLLTQPDTWFTYDDARYVLDSVKHVTPQRHATIRYHGIARPLHTDRLEQHEWQFSFASPMHVIAMRDKMEDDGTGDVVLNSRWPMPAHDGVLADNKTPVWSGRLIFSVLFPCDLEYVRYTGGMSPCNKPGVSAEMETDEEDNMSSKGRIIRIQAGKWISGFGSKDMFGVAQNNIFHAIWRYYGKQLCADLMSDWSYMAHAMLQIRGFSCAVEDVMLGGKMPITRSLVHRLVYKTEHGLTGPQVDNVAQHVMDEYIRASVRDYDELKLRFQRACKVEKENAWNAMESYYAQVESAIFENASDLSNDSVRAIRTRAQDKIERLVLDMGSLTASVTCDAENSISLMKNAGSKGSVVNSTTMSACMPLERIGGSETLASQITARSRILPCDTRGGFSPESVGAIRRGFVDGVSPAELIKHSMATWDKVYRAGRPEQTGYQQTRVAALCENATVYYDGTVRTTPGNIIQLAYGGDGYDAMRVHQIRLNKSILRPNRAFLLHRQAPFEQSTAQEGKMSPVDADLINYIKGLWRGWFACNGCEACVEGVEQHVQLANMLLASRANSHFYGYKTAEALADSGLDVHLNLHCVEITRHHCRDWESKFEADVLHACHEANIYSVADIRTQNYNDKQLKSLFEDMSGVSHAEWRFQVQQMMDCIVGVFECMTIPLDLLLHLTATLHMNSNDFSFVLASPHSLKRLLNDIYRKYVENLAEAGTAVGTSAAQSLGEPNTQNTMKACKMEMGDSKRMKQIATGGDMMEDFLSNREPANIVVTCMLNPTWASTIEEATQVAQSMVCRRLDYYTVHSACFCVEMMPLSAENEEQQSSSDKSVAAQMLPQQHPLHEVISNTILLSYLLASMLEGGASYSSPPPPVHVFALFQLAHDRLPSDAEGRTGLESELSSRLLPFQRGAVIGGPIIHPICPWYWLVWHMSPADATATTLDGTNSMTNEEASVGTANTGLHQELLHNLAEMTQMAALLPKSITLGGIPQVYSILDLAPPRKPMTDAELRMAKHGYMAIQYDHCFKVTFECGADRRSLGLGAGAKQRMDKLNAHPASKTCRGFLPILTHPATMDQYCMTTNLREVEEIFGDDIRYRLTNLGIDDLIGADGQTYMQPRHDYLITEIMCADGIPIAATRSGLAQMSGSHFFTVAAFEDTPSTIMASAIKGRVDPMTQNVANVLVGNRLQFIGCSASSVTSTGASNSGAESDDVDKTEEFDFGTKLNGHITRAATAASTSSHHNDALARQYLETFFTL